jgi:methionyl-tRNA synthetase
MNKFYITNAIPYVNAKPHIGHALEFIYSDVIKRYHKLKGYDTLLLCGSDENAIKNVQAAEKAGTSVQELVDRNAVLFEEVAAKLNVTFDVFQKGSNKAHHHASQKLWELCYTNGDIYKKKYKGLYCVGCEQFYSQSELNVNGECFEHPGKQLEEIEEENYFFKLSKYRNQILKLIETNEYEILPSFRKNEMLSLIKSGLTDFSISRSNQRAKDWGVPVPNDPTQRIYVWFDALNIYQSGIGFGIDEKEYEKWWPADVHVIGKGIIRFHAVYWPAILLSAGLKLPKKLFVHEYFTVGGQKMSKTLGNVYDPAPFLEKYGADALRYFCLSKISPFQDGDFSEEKVFEAYNADLANGLGNLVARVAKLAEKNHISADLSTKPESIDEEINKLLGDFKFNDAINTIWAWVTTANQKINQEKPWELTEEKAVPILKDLIDTMQKIAYNLQPFLPETAEKIQKQFSNEIKAGKPLFPRI